MTLTQLYFLITLTKISMGLIILMVFFGVVLFAAMFIIGITTEQDKRAFSRGTCIMIVLSTLNCFIPSKHELLVMLGGSYYTNGSVVNVKDPQAQKALNEFLESYNVPHSILTDLTSKK